MDSNESGSPLYGGSYRIEWIQRTFLKDIQLINRENIQVTGILLDLFIFCPSFIYKLVKNVQQNFPNMS